MLYHLYDKFLVDGVLTEVLYINAGKAWVAPVEGESVGLKGICIDVLDEKGRNKRGHRAISVVSENSMAV